MAKRTILRFVTLAAVAAVFGTMPSSGATQRPGEPFVPVASVAPVATPHSRSSPPASPSDRETPSALNAQDAMPATVLAYQPASYNDDLAAAGPSYLAQRAPSIAPQTVPPDTPPRPTSVPPASPQRVPENATQPASAAPPVHRSRTTGLLQAVDCRLGRLLVRETQGSTVFSATLATAIYAGTEPLAGVCALAHYVGTQAVVWWVTNGPDRVASRIDVVTLFGRRVVTSGPDQQGTDAALDETRVPLLATTGSGDPPPTSADPPSDPRGSSHAAIEVIVGGVVTARTSNALLVVTSTGARPVVLGPGAVVSGIRNTLNGIAPLDVVAAQGVATTTGTLVATRIAVLGRVTKEVTGYVSAIDPGTVVLNGSLVVTIGSDSAIVINDRLVPFSAVAVGQTVSVELATGSVAVGAAAPAGTGAAGSANLSSNAVGVSGNAGVGANANNPGGGGVSGNAGVAGSAAGNANASANAGVSGNVGSAGNGSTAGNANGSVNASASGSAATSGTANAPANANASAGASASAGTGAHGSGTSVGAGASASVGTGGGGPSLNLGVSGSVGASGGGVSGNAGVSAGHDPATQK